MLDMRTRLRHFCEAALTIASQPAADKHDTRTFTMQLPNTGAAISLAVTRANEMHHIFSRCMWEFRLHITHCLHAAQAHATWPHAARLLPGHKASSSHPTPPFD